MSSYVVMWLCYGCGAAFLTGLCVTLHVVNKKRHRKGQTSDNRD